MVRQRCALDAEYHSYIPSLTFQLAMFPSVIVGDMAGMVKLCAANERAADLYPVVEAISYAFNNRDARGIGRPTSGNAHPS